MSSARPKLILIHGWGLGASVWAPVSALLRENFDLELIDLPGYAPGDQPIADFREAAKSIAASLPENTCICGWSLGAMLALQIALHSPNTIKGLILVGATPSFTQRPDWPDAQAATLLDAFSQAVKDDPTQTRQRFVALLNQGDTAARVITRQMTRALATGHQPARETLLTGLDWLRDVDLRGQIAAIKKPTLLIHGKNDPLMPLAAAQWLQANISGAQLEIHPDAAHAPFAHAPDHFAAQIAAFCHALTV